jgi:2OG-Fe(II) oxygenase superfamily
MPPAPLSLFAPELPPGFSHREAFISADEEAYLVERIGGVTFSSFEMRGVAARRRVAFFGTAYDERFVTPDLPDFLLPVRARFAEWAGVPAGAFAMALINEYTPGAPIGWHRDAPQYDMVAGLSLLSPCRMKLRPYIRPADRGGAPARRGATHEIRLEPRSAYLMTGEARNAYEHHIPAVSLLRYSVTFRTLRA